MAENDQTKALHYSTGKSGVDQIPPDFLLALGDVFSYGEAKYARDNWKQGNNFHEFYGSLLRHALRWWGGEDVDPESGQHHLAHVAWNALGLWYYQKHELGTDDRDSILLRAAPSQETTSTITTTAARDDAAPADLDVANATCGYRFSSGELCVRPFGHIGNRNA